MEPVDFAAIYRQNLAALAAKQQQQGTAQPLAAADAAETDKPN